ncbi:MAG: type II toxin-antitoxin system RelE/ParE family toxin [Mucilaginibacter sp.]
MALEIFYTERFKETLASVYHFILNKFGLSTADKFIAKAEKTIALMAEQPYMFKASAFDENVRVGLITSQCSLFYRVTSSSIHLLFFWDNRQEPILPQ